MYIYAALYSIVLGWMNQLVPFGDHSALAQATADVVLRSSPLYQGDVTRERTAALLVAIQFRESSLNPRAVGDNGRSFCSMQIHASSGGTAALLDDPDACIEAGYRILKQSITLDREHPVAFYARGPRFRSLEAQRLSNDRVAISKRLLAQLDR